MKRIILSALVLFIVQIASVQLGWGAVQSKIEAKSIRSEVLGVEREYTVYLPKNYETYTEKRYPVLYLLHGMMDTNKGWYERGHVKDVMDQLVASGEAYEMFIVTPSIPGNTDTRYYIRVYLLSVVGSINDKDFCIEA